jgi:hypothetical protein
MDIGHVVLGIGTLAGIGYGIMQDRRANRFAVDLSEWVGYALNLESEIDNWRNYAQHLAGKVDSLRIDLAVKSGKAIKIGQDTHVMPMFDGMIGTIESRDIKMDRDNPNRPVFGSGAGKFVPANGKAKDFVPVLRSGEIDPLTGLPYARVEFERKAESAPKAKESKDNGKAKAESKDNGSKAESKDNSKAESPAPSEHSTRIAQVMPMVESDLKRKINTSELDELTRLIPVWIKSESDVTNETMCKRAVKRFSK